MNLFSSDSNPLFTSVTMPSLISVGSVEIETSQTLSQASTTSTNLGVLNFPALKTSGGLSFFLTDYIHTVNFPVLEEVGSLSISGASKLHTFNAPNIKRIGAIYIVNAPSLKTLSFATRLEVVEIGINLHGTGLTDVTFPNVKVLNRLGISRNENLTSIDLPSLTEVRDIDQFGKGTIGIESNSPNLVLSLPKLKTVTANVRLSGLSEIKIPELTTVGDYSKRWKDSGFHVGVGQAWDRPQKWSIPTYLTDFSAPKLRTVEGIISFDASLKLRNISLPSLEEVKEVKINNTAALEIENGIWMPNVKKVENIHLTGLEPRCNFFESLYCQGRVRGSFSCRTPKAEWKSMGSKDWPNFPPFCSGRAGPGSTDLAQPRRTNLARPGIDEYEVRSEFLLVVVLMVLVGLVLRWVVRRWRLLQRISWQTAQRSGAESKGATAN
jgi:hypothetical protein